MIIWASRSLVSDLPSGFLILAVVLVDTTTGLSAWSTDGAAVLPAPSWLSVLLLEELSWWLLSVTAGAAVEVAAVSRSNRPNDLEPVDLDTNL